MATLMLIGDIANGRTTEVSDRWSELLSRDNWIVKRHSYQQYEKVVRSRKGRRREPELILSRFIMEQIRGRPILRSEHVHHKDGDSVGNNRDENLQLMPKAEHQRLHVRGELTAGDTTRWDKIYAKRRKATSGAHRLPSGKWRANYRGEWLGTYATQEEALAVYQAAIGPIQVNFQEQAR